MPEHQRVAADTLQCRETPYMLLQSILGCLQGLLPNLETGAVPLPFLHLPELERIPKSNSQVWSLECLDSRVQSACAKEHTYNRAVSLLFFHLPELEKVNSQVPSFSPRCSSDIKSLSICTFPIPGAYQSSRCYKSKLWESGNFINFHHSGG